MRNKLAKILKNNYNQAESKVEQDVVRQIAGEIAAMFAEQDEMFNENKFFGSITGI